jgi:membrane protease YdiL (CAAX protease family)
MDDSSDPSRRMAGIAMVFESSLVVLAAAIGWLAQRWPLPGVSADFGRWPELLIATGWGILAAVPMIVGLVVVDRYPFGPLRELQRTVQEMLLPWLRHWTIAEMAVISLAAGLGEEMLFRGLLQSSLTDQLGGPAGLLIGVLLASAAFGICHWVTTSYAVLAGLMGVYLGMLLVLTGNLLTPIATHAVYDFVALIYLTRTS